MTVTLDRRGKLTTFVVGLLIRLGGLALIALGNGHDNVWAKASVVVGVVISITGIAVLRFLLFQPLLGKLWRRRARG